MGALKRCEGERREVFGGADHAHQYAAALHASQCLDRCGAVEQRGFDPAQGQKHFAPGISGPGAVGCPLKQGDPQSFFQQPQLLGDRRRRHSQQVRGRGDAAALHQRAESTQLPQRGSAGEIYKIFFH